jgi:hypothetical protein
MPKPSVVFEPASPASTAVYWDLVTCVCMENRSHQCLSIWSDSEETDQIPGYRCNLHY